MSNDLKQQITSLGIDINTKITEALQLMDKLNDLVTEDNVEEFEELLDTDETLMNIEADHEMLMMQLIGRMEFTFESTDGER